MKSEDDKPALEPLDDRNPFTDRLFHEPSEMTDEQFAILAAEWAEGDLEGESFAEIESIFRKMPERKLYAEGFKKIRLHPGTETWGKRNDLLRTSPLGSTIRRAAIVTLAAAAVCMAVLTIKPLLRQFESGVSTESSVEMRIVTATPLMRMKYYPSTKPKESHNVTPVAKSEPETIASNINPDQIIEPLAMNSIPVVLKINQQVDPLSEKPVYTQLIQGTAAEVIVDENWIAKGFSAIARLISKDNNGVDGYMIAGACVKGVNSLLGWDMQLERKITAQGEAASVNFSSSLLSFKTPAKKIGVEQ
jgi:hypothetical protein